jgi:beta-phosphoglucomutase
MVDKKRLLEEDFGKLVEVESYDFPGLGTKIVGEGGVAKICKTRDGKAVFLLHNDGNAIVYFPTRVNTAVRAFYNFVPAAMPKKVKAVLMDLDGTSVHSEHFWIWVIERVTARLLNDDNFRFTAEDLPHVSGYSVSEHLQYCINKYCHSIEGVTLSKAREIYFDIVHREIGKIISSAEDAKIDAFVPSPYLKEFLLNLKDNGVKIGLVSSGLYEKAWPEIVAAFKKLGLGDPAEFYDAIVTAGFTIKKGQVGTLGELEPKPHPWLYAEALFSLGVSSEEAIGIEDSGAGILAIRAAGLPAIGIVGGNIDSGGERSLCTCYVNDLKECWELIKDRV